MKSTAPPQILDHELIAKIGTGAYGEVWLARNRATGAPRAVKIVYRATFADERPFNREFEGIKKFDAVSRSHPSQLALFHVGRNEEGGYFYYVMELADSIPSGRRNAEPASLPPKRQSASEAIETTSDIDIATYRAQTLRAELALGRIPAARVLEIAAGLAEALCRLHANGLIHRDVKPSNIIFVGGLPKLADIGLVTDDSDTRSIVGTEGYLAREGPGTASADIFALGKVLYEALTGFDRRQYPELPAGMRDWSDGKLAFEINTIILKACAPNSKERYVTANAMLSDLRLLGGGKSIKQRRSLQRFASWVWKAAAIFVLSWGAYHLVQWNRVKLNPPDRSSSTWAAQSGAANIAAWQARERAVVMSDARTGASFTNSIQEFERAIALDPKYAVAWLGLSSRLFLLVQFGHAPGSVALKRAKECALKAIELVGPDGGGAAGGRFMLGECILAMEYDMARAEPHYREALRLFPKVMPLQVNFASRLIAYERFEEAEKILKDMIYENPSEADPCAALGNLYSATGRYPQSVSLFGDAIRLKNDQLEAHFERASISWVMDERRKAARDWLRFVELSGFFPLSSHKYGALLQRELAENGPERFLDELIKQLELALARGEFVSSYDLARLHAHASNTEQALDYLEKAVGEHRPMTLRAKVSPVFEELRSEPRFQVVLRRLKLIP